MQQNETSVQLTMNTDDPLADQVKEIIVETLELDIDPSDISLNDVIFEGDLDADSISSLEVITRVEEECGFLFDDDEINPDMFATVGVLVETIRAKLDVKT